MFECFNSLFILAILIEFVSRSLLSGAALAFYTSCPVSFENKDQSFVREIRCISTKPSTFMRPVFTPDNFDVSDVKCVQTTLTSLVYIETAIGWVERKAQ